MKDKITSVYFFPSGNTACFNSKGEQVGELQESWFLMWVKHAESLGYDVSNLNEIHLPSGMAKLLKFNNEDGTEFYNWQMQR